MRSSPTPFRARLAHGIRLTQLDTQARILSALALVVVIVVLLAGQQTLQVARQNTDAELRDLAETQFASLAQAVTDAAILHDYDTLQTQLGVQAARGILRYAEYTAPDGQVLRREAGTQHVERPDWFARLARLEPPRLQANIVIGGTDYGQLAIQLSPHVREDFLWDLVTRLMILLAGAFILLGWLTRTLLRINLQDLTRLRGAARLIETGDYRTRIPVRTGSPPELRETIRAFNHMGAALEQLLTDLNEQQAALDHTACISETDLAGNITYVNDLFCAVSGYDREALLGRNHRIVSSGQHDAAFFDALWTSITRGRTWRGEMCNRTRDGQLFWAATTIIPIKDDDGLPVKYLSIRFDITQRKLDEAALSAEKERWQVTLQSINDAVIVTQADGRVAYINPAAEHLLGIALKEAASTPLKHLMQFDQIKGEDEGPACFLSSASVSRGQIGTVRLNTRQGQARAISYSCAPLDTHDGVGAVYVLRDETEKKQLLDSLREMAFHDPLTTLPNRRAVEGRLERAMRNAREDAQQHAFCYIDLDQFKLVNDTCGHSVGDSLLKNIAQTMKETLPGQAYLGRLGGDEFGLILFDTEPRDAIEICRQLVHRIRDYRFEHNGRRFTLGACAGIAPITAAAATTSGILIQADMACYRAKSEGSGRVMLYEADEVGFRRLEAEMGWAADFAQALEANQFLPYRQLIQPASPGGQPHYEVLIRWQRNGLIEGPAKLLPALERYGQAPILDRWMLEAVISYLASQPDDQAVYFINLSGKTVADETFLGIVCALLDRYGVAGERLGFEVTETAAVVNLEDAQRLIHGLRERGCQFALDDFGRDASSFFYLKHLPADYLKIDGAFVRGMLDDRRDQAIVRSIAKLASDFGMHSIAEQVEDADMAGLLRDIGVDYLQGYHIHRPEAFPGWQAVTRLPHLTRVK